MGKARRPLLVLFCLFAALISAKDVDEIEGSGEGSAETPPSSVQPNVAASTLTLLNAANDLDDNVAATKVSSSTSTSTSVSSTTRAFPTPKPSVGECPPKMDVVFLLDTSGSIEQIYEEHVRWTVALVNSLPIEKDAVRVAAVQYAGFPLTEFALGTYPNAQDIRQHLEQIHFQSGVTRTGYALRKAEAELFQENRGARSDAAKVIVLFTDGLSIDDPLKPAHQLRDIKGVKIYVVSVGSDGFEPEMNRIAGEKENVFGPSELARLRTALLRDTERTRACSRIGKLPNTVLKPASTLDDVQKFAKFPIEQAAVPQAHVDKIPERRIKQLSNIDSTEGFSKDDQLINLRPNTRRHGFTRFSTTTSFSTTTEAPQTTRRFRPRSSSTTLGATTTEEATTKSRFNKPRKDKSTTVTSTTTPEPTTRRLTTTSRRFTSRQTSQPSSSSSTSTTTRTTTVPFKTTPVRALQGDASRKPQEVSCPMDILFVVDSSGSVQRVYEEQKAYLNDILAEIEPGDQSHRVALVQFSGSNHQKTEWAYDAFEDNSALMHAFQSVRHFTGTTYIGAALQAARAVLDTRRRNVPSILILLSDGFSQDDASEQAKVIRNLPNVEFIALSVSELSNAQYLSELTDDPSRVYIGEKKEALRQKFFNYMSVSFQDQTLTNVNNYAAIRQFLEQLKKFISSAEHQNGNVSGGALSDAGVVLLRLKDQLVLYEERNGGLPDELFQKQFNGLLVLIKVVVILQGFVSFTSSKTKFSQILMRKNSSTTLKRKASVAEADCMECIKLILHKTPFSWQTLFENGSNLEVILYSVNSPQLDSKCYALEILLSLLDHPQGFDLLLRALSVIAARQGEYLRMPLIISQLKHGLHTSKLHIQILVVRLLNKLMLKAPSTNHRVMVQCEISLARFSPEYVDRLLTNSKTPLGGTNTLMEELDQWRKLLVPLDYDSNPHHLAEPVQSPYALSTSPQNFGSYRTRNRTAYKNQQGQSTVIKNVEKQRMKRQSEQAEKQRSMYASERDLARAAALDSPKTDRAYQTRRNQFDVGGRMRRVKSESAMITDEAEAEYYSPQQRGLNRFATPRSHSPPVELNAKLSRSTHDLSRFDYNTREDVAVTDRLNSKTSSSARSPVPYRSLGRKGNYSLSPRPATNDARERRPNGGFSYIFPSAPVVNDAEHRRARPSDYPSQRPPSAPNFTRFGEDRPIAPPGSPRTPLASPRSCGSVNLGRQDRNVVYIPINMEEREDVGNQRYDKRRQTDSELEHRMRSSNGNGNTYGSSFGEDVRDALSQFDYLNDYDATSIRSGKVRSGNPTEIYHF